ncbi:hypothetical protein IT568_10495 [bacterium]|nr:hypothetical protein [bacterium]
MKIKLVFLFSLFFAMTSCALLKNEEAPEVEWEKTFGTENFDVANSIFPTKDEGFIFCGYTNSNDEEIFSFWLTKLDKRGVVEWEKTFGGNENYVANSVIQTSEGGFAVCGYTGSKGEENTDFWILKLDKEGNPEWEKTLGGSDFDVAISIVQTSEGGFAVCGYTSSEGEGKNDFWVVKLSENGEIDWEKVLGGNDVDRVSSIIETQDKSFILCGYTASKGNGWSDAWLIKIGKNGNLIWEKTFGSPNEDIATSVVETKDGNLIFCGRTSAKGPNEFDFWVVCTNSSGKQVWEQILGGSDFDKANSIIKITGEKEETFVLAGYTASRGSGKEDFWLVKINGAGELIWEKMLGGEEQDEANCVVQTKDEGLIVCGFTTSKGFGEKDAWIVKFKPNSKD